MSFINFQKAYFCTINFINNKKMKKIFMFVAIATIFVTTQVNAQNFKYGIKGGANFATFGGKDTHKDTKFGTAWNVGLVGEYFFNEKMAIQPELLFSHQGAKVSDVKHKLNYVTLPIMFKYNIYKGLNLQAGPQIGYLIAAKEGDEDVKSKMNKVDFAINLGVGYRFTNNIFMDLRHNFGVSKLDKDGDAYIFNRVLQLSVGYLF